MTSHSSDIDWRRQGSQTKSDIPLRDLVVPARSLYIHVPFCFHKCHYCDFYSIVDSRDRQEVFADRLIREVAAIGPWLGELDTLFVGGGTPTLLRADLWELLLGALTPWLRGGREGSAPTEFTVECNPETATVELMQVLAGGGVNRISIGAQSFRAEHLKTLERWHDPENVARAVELARDAGIRRHSLDLIYAIPGQSLGEAEADLRRALAIGTEHVSAYALTYEPNTAMTMRLARGDFERADEDQEADMQEQCAAILGEAGLQRYEVSNFARPGGECAHNLAYWRQEEWMAAGPSASGHAQGWRWKVVPNLGEYLNGDQDGFARTVDSEGPDARRAVAERLMTGLRLREGVEIDAITRAGEAASPGAADRLRATAGRWIGSGHLADDDGRWCPTDSGFLMADGMAADLMNCV
ncbi:MAG: radical SAM family heme chaperone HemW [Phycisphaerales bacterium]|nr:radical SAM family heme chaperone HemW [Phycisphaerales bacterium]